MDVGSLLARIDQILPLICLVYGPETRLIAAVPNRGCRSWVTSGNASCGGPFHQPVSRRRGDNLGWN
jgi:hypothetical protein